MRQTVLTPAAVWRRDGVETSAEAGSGGDGNGGELLQEAKVSLTFPRQR
ncbi:hypothetical protein A2U01_0058582 [Trifolium medium]|uniref:Uncharacterized protein n=1 Tax=Trifolium medium TaxID=97028 RepID=A0A392RL77_9FABA|nr:hypothetical protein [Trifolium medium]